MSVSELKLIKRCTEFCGVDQIKLIPHNTRGVEYTSFSTVVETSTSLGTMLFTSAWRGD